MRRTLIPAAYALYESLFDNRVASIMQRAQKLAEHHHNGELNTSHVLVAALENGEFIHLLSGLGVTLQQVNDLKTALTPLLQPTMWYFEEGKPLRLSHDCCQAMAYALHEANRTCQRPIQMPHLLFALSGSHGDAAGYRLQSMGVTSERVRRRIDADRRGASSSGPDLLEQLDQEERELWSR